MVRYRVRVTYTDGREAFICKDVSDDPAEFVLEEAFAAARSFFRFFPAPAGAVEVQAVTVVRS